jgi:hypothetical protein
LLLVEELSRESRFLHLSEEYGVKREPGWKKAIYGSARL